MMDWILAAPATPRGNESTCALQVFSGWYWRAPCNQEDSATAAELIAECVMLDLAINDNYFNNDVPSSFHDSIYIYTYTLACFVSSCHCVWVVLVGKAECCATCLSYVGCQKDQK